MGNLSRQIDGVMFSLKCGIAGICHLSSPHRLFRIFKNNVKDWPNPF